MGVVVEGIVERLAFAGADAVAVEKGGGGAQGVLVLAGEQLVEVEGEEAFVRPLGAVEEDDVAVGAEEGPAGRLGLTEDVAADASSDERSSGRCLARS